MKFKTYNRVNSSRRVVSGRPHLRLNFRSGALLFNSAAITLLGLKDNTLIEFLQSSEDQSEWYVALNRPEGFVLRKRASGGLVFSSKSLCYNLINSLNLPKDQKSVLLPLASEIDPDANAYAILTSQLQK